MKLLNILSNAFIPSILPNFTGLSNLERLLINRAIKTSILSAVTSEWSLDNIIINLFNSHNNNMWILSVITIFSYGYYKAYLNTHRRLKTISIYDDWNKNIRDMLFILFIIFTKDVQNAL